VVYLCLPVVIVLSKMFALNYLVNLDVLTSISFTLRSSNESDANKAISSPFGQNLSYHVGSNMVESGANFVPVCLRGDENVLAGEDQGGVRAGADAGGAGGAGAAVEGMRRHSRGDDSPHVHFSPRKQPQQQQEEEEEGGINTNGSRAENGHSGTEQDGASSGDLLAAAMGHTGRESTIH
jgi:hypothetical protein